MKDWTESYSPEYFASIESGARRSARLLVPRLQRIYRPASVLDVGCGTGDWMDAWRETVPEVVGIDRYGPSLNKPDVVKHDLRQPLTLKRFDIVMCLEVAEHLEEEYATVLVESLVNCCRIVIVFSAATVGQGGGPTHVNEQPHEYWHSLFLKRDCFFHPLGSVCPNGVEWWYRNNLFAYYPERT